MPTGPNIAIAIMALLIVVLAVLSYIQWHRSNKKVSTLEQRLSSAQLDLHFVYNALMAAQAHILRNDAPTAIEYLSEVAKLIRTATTNSKRSTIPIAKDIEALEGLLQLQNLRLGGRLERSITVDPALDTEKVVIPPLLAQPVIESIVGSSLNLTDFTIGIAVCYELMGDALQMEIRANRHGSNGKSHNFLEIDGQATQAVNERLKAYNRTKKHRIGLKIVKSPPESDNLSDGFRVRFSIPISTN